MINNRDKVKFKHKENIRIRREKEIDWEFKFAHVERAIIRTWLIE